MVSVRKDDARLACIRGGAAETGFFNNLYLCDADTCRVLLRSQPLKDPCSLRASQPLL